MDAYATKLAEAFSAKIIKIVYERSLTDVVVNRDYEGEVKGKASKCNIPTLGALGYRTYTGADMDAASDLEESNAILTTDQMKVSYFKIKSIDEFKSYIKNPKSTVVEQLGNELKKVRDTFVLGFYGDVAAGNRVGTDYTTGTVTVDVTTGAVTGSGTTFTSAMVGRGFKAAGHTKWYRVKSYASATSIVIEDDSDDLTSAYTGGAIAGGATYTIEAATVLTLDASNLLTYINTLKQKLDEAEVPDDNRILVVPPVVENLITRATGVNIAVPAVYDELVKRGYITQLSGFKVYRSNRLTGNNTSGYRIMAMHPMFLTFADAMTENGVEPLIKNFGEAYKSLYVYGAKVADERRKFAAELYAKV